MKWKGLVVESCNRNEMKRRNGSVGSGRCNQQLSALADASVLQFRYSFGAVGAVGAAARITATLHCHTETATKQLCYVVEG